MTNKLPEGWGLGESYKLDRVTFERTDGAWVTGLDDVWAAFPSEMEWLEGSFTSAIAAMRALNEKYSLEVKERGEN